MKLLPKKSKLTFDPELTFRPITIVEFEFKMAKIKKQNECYHQIENIVALRRKSVKIENHSACSPLILCYIEMIECKIETIELEIDMIGFCTLLIGSCQLDRYKWIKYEV